MSRAAVLRTVERRLTRLLRLEPADRVAAGDHVALDPKVRHEEGVEHILRREDDLDGCVHRGM
jgi:hypothetical protein